jgi:hypothetical protein
MAKKTSKKTNKSKKKKHAVKVKLNKDTPYEIEWLYFEPKSKEKLSSFGKGLVKVLNKLKSIFSK